VYVYKHNDMAHLQLLLWVLLSFQHSELLPLVSYALISPMVPASLTWVLNWHISLIGKGQVQMHTGAEGGGYRQVVLKPVDPCILNLSSSDCLLHLTITPCIKPFTCWWRRGGHSRVWNDITLTSESSVRRFYCPQK
jgi:hypothetical protein